LRQAVAKLEAAVVSADPSSGGVNVWASPSLEQAAACGREIPGHVPPTRPNHEVS